MSTSITFTAGDLARFATVSGDWNPIHVDAARARRLLGGAQVVHGVLTLLWALDCYAAQGGILPQQMQVFFRRPVLAGETLQMEISNDDGETRLSIRRQSEEVASILMQGQAKACAAAVGKGDPAPRIVQDQAFADLLQANGTLSLGFAATSLPAYFAHLPAWLGDAALAALMACSRLVGMECPGLHSLFTGLAIRFDDTITAPALSWQVTRHSSPAAPLKIRVEGGGLTGEITAMMRPAPVQQPAMDDVRKAVPPQAFAAQKAVIIGGSRGLGELTAKTIAAGGGQVVITYLQGHEDAARVAAEIGPQCRLLQLDVLTPNAAETLAPYRDWMTHLYYFATARITKGADAHAAAAFEAVYVTAFEAIITQLAQSSRPLAIFYPSSVFVSERPAAFEAYSNAKARGEALCDALTARHTAVTILAQRLPRLETDQTSSLLAPTLPPALPIVLAYVTAMQTSENAHGR